MTLSPPTPVIRITPPCIILALTRPIQRPDLAELMRLRLAAPEVYADGAR